MDDEALSRVEAHARLGFPPTPEAALLMADEIRRLRSITESLAARCAGQAEIIARRAERPPREFYDPVNCEGG